MSEDGTPFVRAEVEEDSYNWMHRAFLHAFQTHRVMTLDEVKNMLAIVLSTQNPDRPWTTGDITQPHLTNTIQTINAKLDFFDYELRTTKDQSTKETIYALVNNASDSLTQLATTFTPSEIAYIRRLLDYMFETANTKTRQVMAIKHTDASNLARPSRRSRQSQINAEPDDTQEQVDTGISLSEADAVLTSLVSERFFQKSRAEYYSLAPRGLIELRAYLKETYNETAEENEAGTAVTRIHDCEGCKEIVTVGIRCNDRDCGVRWHDACANSFYRGRASGGKRCPACGEVCTGDVFVGERADRVGGGRRSTQGRRGEEDEESE